MRAWKFFTLRTWIESFINARIYSRAFNIRREYMN
jgi:hypothetical protein